MPRSKSAAKIQLTSYNELFHPTDIEDTKKNEEGQIVDIPINQLVSFTNHPFHVIMDEKMDELVDSVREQGILVPIIVRVIGDSKYEIISGHRRRKAAQLAGLSEIPAMIRDYSDDEATIAMVNANLQREKLLPSEKAYAYKLKYEALKHQGSSGGSSLRKMEEAFNDNYKSIQRFITLTKLTSNLLQMVDKGRIGFIPAVNVAGLSIEHQEMVCEQLQEKGKKLTTEQSERLKEHEKKNMLSAGMISWILGDSKTASHTEHFSIRQDKVRQFFDPDATDDYIEETILQLLERWKDGEEKR